jgi:hypothetical protein
MQQISDLIWVAGPHIEGFKSRVRQSQKRDRRLAQMESSMQQLNEPRARPRMAKVLATAAALLCATALGQPNPAYAGPHGGGGGGGFHGGGGGGFHGGGFGGFHGGGFGGFHGGFAGMHGGGFGGFHGGGFHEGGFHGGGFREGGFHGDRFHDGRFDRDRFRDNRFFFGGAFAYPYGWDYSPDYGYYDYSQPYASQTWYYCYDPAGYYPYVTQCNTGWQSVPAN